MDNIISFSDIDSNKVPSVLTYQRKVCKDISDICKPIADKFGVTFFAQFRAFRDGRVTSLMTDTAFPEYYINCKYPIYLYGDNGPTMDSGIYIAANLNKPFQKQIEQERRSLFGLDHMIHIIDKQNEYDEMYSFATTPENYKMVNQFINNIDIIRHFILYYKDKSADLIKKADRIRYKSEHSNLKTYNISDIYSCGERMNKDVLNNMVLKKICVPIGSGEVFISKREFDCLKYAVKNYTLKEIAKFLNLSPRTVETYVNNLKLKLKCDTRTHLIDIVSALKLF